MQSPIFLAVLLHSIVGQMYVPVISINTFQLSSMWGVLVASGEGGFFVCLFGVCGRLLLFWLVCAVFVAGQPGVCFLVDVHLQAR